MKANLRAVDNDAPDADPRAELRRLQRVARGDDAAYLTAREATAKARADLAAVNDRLASERSRLEEAKAALPDAVGTSVEASATAELRAIKNGIEDLTDLAAAAESTVARHAAAEAEIAPSSTAAADVHRAAVALFRPHVENLRRRILQTQDALAADRLALCALQADGVIGKVGMSYGPFGPVDPATAPLKLPTEATWQHAISRGARPAPELAAFRTLLQDADAPLPDPE